MYLLDHLPPALAEFILTKAGSSRYEHALVWSLVVVVCVLAVLALT